VKENRGIPRDQVAAEVRMWSHRLVGSQPRNQRLFTTPWGGLEAQQYIPQVVYTIDNHTVRFVNNCNTGEGFVASTGHIVMDKLYTLGNQEVNAQEVVRMLEAVERGEDVEIQSNTPFFKLESERRGIGRVWQVSFKPRRIDTVIDAVLLSGSELLSRKMTRPFLATQADPRE
jgi:hypothetical protein